MSAILILDKHQPKRWEESLTSIDPQRDIRIWPDTGNLDEISYALTWKPPTDVLDKLPNLKVIFNLGAGVDHIMKEPNLPDVPICRVVDDDMTGRMSEYIIFNVLLHHRQHLFYVNQQKNNNWQSSFQPHANDVMVGIMGLGVLGQDAAKKLSVLGFKVSGWSQSKKDIPDVSSYAGEEELSEFLGQTDILVVLLPATPQTKGVLNLSLFKKLNKDGALGGPILINAGRGSLQSEDDIIEALDSGILKAASLDVFNEEPLPSDHPIWRHPDVVITPHVAADSMPGPLSRNIMNQIVNYEAGKELLNIVDRTTGY